MPAMEGRLAGAVLASILVHGAGLAGLDALPRSWPLGAPAASEAGARHFTVSLQSAAAREREAMRKQGAEAFASLAPAAAPRGETAEPKPGLLPRARYYTSDELDRRPQPTSAIEPRFPAIALTPVGRVALAVYVSENGAVDKVEVESADLTGDFAAAARQAFGGATFLPGIKGGVAVKSLMRIEVRFGEPLPNDSPAWDTVRREEAPLPRARPRRGQ
jgi:outer membrane biosynthesis protein TonB